MKLFNEKEKVMNAHFIFITCEELESIFNGHTIIAHGINEAVDLNKDVFDPVAKMSLIVRGILGTVRNYVILLKSMDEVDKAIKIGLAN